MNSTILDKIKSLETQYQKYFFINEDIDRRMVSFQGNKIEAVNRWFHYREGFSLGLMNYIFKKISNLPSDVFLDPFAGSGVAPFAAADRGMSSIAVELLPIGNFLMEFNNIIRRDKELILLQWIPKLKQDMNKILTTKSKNTLNYLTITKHAFPEQTELQLCSFLNYANNQDVGYKHFLLFLALSIVEKVSYTRKDGQYLRWDCRSAKYSGKVKKTNFIKNDIIPFEQALGAKINEIYTDLLEMDYKSSTQVTILNNSVFNAMPSIDNNSIGCVITSPPYCNRYDYTRTYALELSLLGVDDKGIKELRQNLLSCTVENKAKLFNNIDKNLTTRAEKIFQENEIIASIIEFLTLEHAHGRLNNKGIISMVRGYLYESLVHLLHISEKMKKGGYYVMVNDNVQYNGVPIPIDILLSSFAEKASFEIDKIWVLPKGKGNSSQQMKRYGRNELRKCVYVWKKS